MEAKRSVCTMCGENCVILVEQNAKLALGLANYGYVLETGEIVLHDKASALMGSEHVRKVHLGQ